jgi:O-antigen ligase
MARILFWALVVTVGLAPLPLASNRPWAWGLLGLSIGVQLVLFALGTLLDRDLIQMNWRRYGWAMLGFASLVVWMVVQQATLTQASWHDPLWHDAGRLLGMPLKGAIAIDPGGARATIVRLITYAGIFFLALHLCRSRERARLALWSIALAGALYAAYGLAVYFSGSEMVLGYKKWVYLGSLTATFINRNSFAAYAGMTLIAALALILAESEEALRYGLFNRVGLLHFMDTARLGPYALLVFAVVISTALLFTQSRGGFMSTVAGVAAFAFAMRMAHRQRGTAGRWPLFALSIALAAVVLVSFSGSNLIGRFSNFASVETGRGVLYELTLRAIGDHPWMGVGLGGFHDTFQMYRDSRLDDAFATFDKAHNTYLELALELGLPAFAALMAILIGIVATCARGLVARRRDLVYPAAGLGVTALMALHSTVDFSLQMPATAAAYALVMGVAYAQSFSFNGRRIRNGAAPHP